MNHDNVFALKNPAVPNEVRDTMTEVLREGARTLLAQAIEAEVAEFWPGMPISAMRSVGRGWCATATCRSARCRRALAR